MPRMLATLASSVLLSRWVSSPCTCCSSSISHAAALLPNVLDLQLGSQEYSSRALSSTGFSRILAEKLENKGQLPENEEFNIEEPQPEERGLCPTVESLNRVISLYREDGRLDDALKVWNSFNQMGVPPNLATYGILIGIFQQQDDVFNALRVYRTVREQFQVVEDNEVHVLEELVRNLCLGRINSGLENDENRQVLQDLFQQMQDAQIPLCKFVCRGLLLKCGNRLNDHLIMGSFYRYMRAKRILTTALCNYCIQVLGKQCQFWAALEVYEQMMEFGPRPDMQTRSFIRIQFGRLLNEAKQKMMWKLGIQLIGKMLDRGLVPGKHDWEVVLITCAKAGRTEETVILFQKMVSSKCKPEERAFGALLSAFEKEGRIQDMERVVISMKKSGVPISEWIYTTLITGYGKARNLEGVEGVVRDMVSTRVELSLVTFNAIITACARMGNADSALEWFRKMETAGFKGNSTTFNKLVEALARGGRWEEAVFTYVQMKRLKLQPSPWAYDAIVVACKSSGVQVQHGLIGYRPRQLRSNLKYKCD